MCAPPRERGPKVVHMKPEGPPEVVDQVIDPFNNESVSCHMCGCKTIYHVRQVFRPTEQIPGQPIVSITGHWNGCPGCGMQGDMVTIPEFGPGFGPADV